MDTALVLQESEVWHIEKAVNSKEMKAGDLWKGTFIQIHKQSNKLLGRMPLYGYFLVSSMILYQLKMYFVE
jgi:hypothetical protein